MLLAGAVEGFYGQQWSHKDRLNFIEFLHKYNFNTYIYAPKGDPFHRKKWYKLYPEKYLRKIYEIVKVCKDREIFFIYALSPGLSIRYSSNEDFNKLINKYKQILNLDIEYVGLFLDDIPLTFKYLEDKNRFNSLGNAHNYIARKIFLELKKINPKIKLILCPTIYWGVFPRKYLIELSNNLPEEIIIMWTGKYVVSPTITEKDAINFGKIIKRKPFLWDNYPVNDYNRGRLHLGPFQGRSAKLIKHLSGYVANPMNEVEASKIPLITLSEYLKDPQNYNPEKAWRKAIKRITNKSNRVFIEFAEHSKMSPLNFVESKKLMEDINNVCREGDAALININRIERLMYRLSYLPKDIEKSLKNKNSKLLKEIKPWFPKLIFLSRLGLKTIQLLKTSDINSCKSIVKEISFLMKKVKKDKHQLMGEYILRSTFICGSDRKIFESLIFRFLNGIFSWKIYTLGKNFDKILKEQGIGLN